MLELSPTIRLPEPDELPNNPEVFERLKFRETANIVEGFKLLENTTHDLPFRFYAEINVNNSQLWEVFLKLTDLLPSEVSLIINAFEEEPHISAPEKKSHILTSLETFKIELTQDCTLEFGLIHQSDITLEELFVSESKYLKVWSSNEPAFRQIMQLFKLRETPNLNFIDEFPKVVEPLKMHNPAVAETEYIIHELVSRFQ